MNDFLKYEETLVFSLRKLYRLHGYSPFKMSKFEPYDLYADKKDFLVSDSIITFSDTDGTLLALKPDVTLSIVKNYRSDHSALTKTYYNETVYRPIGSGQGYGEIMQTGLECIGKIDHVSICEVLLLAVKSLETISPRYVLDISHMELPTQILSHLKLRPEQYASVLTCLAEKNEDALNALPFSIPQTVMQQLRTLIRLYGPMDDVLAQSQCLQDYEAFRELKILSETMHTLGIADRINLDYSITASGNYYNGIAFRGYIADVPNVILSGGQYDRLVQKMGKSAGGIGFAVYLNELVRFKNTVPEYDYEAVLLYDDTCSAKEVLSAAKTLREKYTQVYTTNKLSENVTYRKLYVLQDGRFDEIG